MINVKDVMNTKETHTKVDYEGLVKAPYCSAEEALTRRVYMQDILNQIERIEKELKEVVTDNAMTLPYEQNKKYSKFVNGDLKVLKFEIKRLIKAETELELLGK